MIIQTRRDYSGTMPLSDESLRLGRRGANIAYAKIIVMDVLNSLFIVEASMRSIKRHKKQRPLISTFGTIVPIARSIFRSRPWYGSKGHFG